jgi:hypothetical protein
LRAFAVAVSLVRFWLLLRGHVKASAALKDITWESAREAPGEMKEMAMEDRLPRHITLRNIQRATKGGPPYPDMGQEWSRMFKEARAAMEGTDREP